MDDAFETVALRKLLDAQSAEPRDRFLPLLHRWKSAQFPDTEELMAKSPIANYSERDLLRYVSGAGFREIRMEFHVDVLPSIITSWNVFLGSSPHPWAPTVGMILEKQFTVEERQLFEHAIRPLVEGGQSTSTERIAYISARKPG